MAHQTLVYLATGIGLGVLLVELGLRMYAARNADFASRLLGYDLLAVKIAPMGELGYRQRANTSLRYKNGAVATSNAFGYRGPEVPFIKPTGTIRIVLAGGSTTHGWCVNDDQTIDFFPNCLLALR